MQFARLKPAQIKKDPKKVKKNYVKRQGSVPVQFSCNPCSEASLQVLLICSKSASLFAGSTTRRLMCPWPLQSTP